MRIVLPLVTIALLAGCTASPAPPETPSPKQQARLAQLLDGKVAGTPRSCIPNWRTYNMIAIDDSTLIFQESPGRLWLQKPKNPCNLISAGPYALVTRDPTGQLCNGDIAQVMDTMSRTNVGSCVLGDFVPYARPGS